MLQKTKRFRDCNDPEVSYKRGEKRWDHVSGPSTGGGRGPWICVSGADDGLHATHHHYHPSPSQKQKEWKRGAAGIDDRVRIRKEEGKPLLVSTFYFPSSYEIFLKRSRTSMWNKISNLELIGLNCKCIINLNLSAWFESFFLLSICYLGKNALHHHCSIRCISFVLLFFCYRTYLTSLFARRMNRRAERSSSKLMMSTHCSWVFKVKNGSCQKLNKRDHHHHYWLITLWWNFFHSTHQNEEERIVSHHISSSWFVSWKERMKEWNKTMEGSKERKNGRDRHQRHISK